MRNGFPQSTVGSAWPRLLLAAFAFVLWASYVGLPCFIRDSAQVSHGGGMTCDIRAVFKPTVEPTDLFRSFVVPEVARAPMLAFLALVTSSVLAVAAIAATVFRRIRGAPFASSDLKPMAFLAARMDG